MNPNARSYGHRVSYGVLWGMLITVLAFVGSVGATPVGADEDSVDSSLIISTESLEGLLNDLDLRVIDLRDGEKFREGRIPNALSLPVQAVLDPDSRIPGARRSDQDLAFMFGKLGIRGDSRVVLYDDVGGHLAARVLFIFQYLGHQKVSVLDGGFPKWEEEGRHITQQTRRVKEEYFPIDLTPRLLATAEWILENLNDPNVVILDVRPRERYIQSHIPGAINIPWKGNLNSDDTWKSPEELRKIYESAGVTEDKKIVVYCQGGNHNGHSYLTLKALGYPRAMSYERAWPEWGSDPSLPKVGVSPEGSPTVAGNQSPSPQIDGPQQAEQDGIGAVGDPSNLTALEMGLIGGMALLGTLMLVTISVVWRARRQRVLGQE